MERKELMEKILPIVYGLMDELAKADIKTFDVCFGNDRLQIMLMFDDSWLINDENGIQMNYMTFDYRYRLSYHHLEGIADHIRSEYRRYVESEHMVTP